MDREQSIIQAIESQGMLPLFYHDDSQVCLSVTESLYTAGVRCIEFTNRGKNAFANFQQLVAAKAHKFPDLLLGIGTIKTADDASRFIDAGADFLVSPVFDNSVCDVAYMHKTLWIPGCMTPTEIHVAQLAGCRLVKLFPGNVLQPAYVSAIMPLFSGIGFMVTGGVEATAENIRAWLKSGVTAVGMGSKLISDDVMKNQDYAGLQTTTANVLALIRQARS